MWIMKLHSFDLDLDPMTFALKLYLDIVKMYVYTKNEASTFNGSEVIALTDRLEWNYYLPAHADGNYCLQMSSTGTRNWLQSVSLWRRQN